MTRDHARLFIAVDPPSAVCEELVAWARAALRGLGVRAAGEPSARVLDPELLHITLCFLGERPLAELDAIAQALASCTAGLGELSLGAPLWLPPRNPRALAVEIHDDAHCGLEALHRTLLLALAESCGFREQDSRRFRAHVTVARLRGGGRRPRRPGPGGGEGGEVSRWWAGQELPATPALSFVPAALALYRSWLSPAGASYEALAQQSL